MEDINKILKTYSKLLFYHLEGEDYHILKQLAKNGPQNLSQLDKSRRWSMKRRLHGSKRFFGLIPHEYVYPIPTNNKIIQYDLAMKGLLAVLAVTRFENIHLVKDYKEFLKTKIKKIKLVNWSLDFIKYEIALIVMYNYLQGLDWTRFKFVQWYWDNLKEEDANISEFIVNPIFLKQSNDTLKEYDYVKHDYMQLFMVLNFCTIWIELGKQSDPDILEKDLTGRKFIHLWYHYLNRDVSAKSLKEKQQYETNKTNVQKHYTAYMKSIRKEAREIVLRNGYEIQGHD